MGVEGISPCEPGKRERSASSIKSTSTRIVLKGGNDRRLPYPGLGGRGIFPDEEGKEGTTVFGSCQPTAAIGKERKKRSLCDNDRGEEPIHL